MSSKCSRRSEALTEAAQRLGRYEPQYVITYFTDPKIHCESGRTRRAAVLMQHSVAVSPVIGIIWDKNDFNPVPNAAEVESQPLEMFLENENRREEKIEGRGNEYLLHFFDYQAEKRSYTIWAFTAAVLIKVASIVYQRPPALEEHRPKFWSGSRL